MARILAFNLLYLICSLFALVRGGAPERTGAIILIADFELSLWVVGPMDSRFTGVEWTMFAVDAFAFTAFYVLSLFTARFWPAWMAGLQGCVAMSHLAGLRPEIIPWAYGTVVAVWAYVSLVLLAIATWRHRHRLRRYGVDPAWCWELSATYLAGTSCDERAATSEGSPPPKDIRPGKAIDVGGSRSFRSPIDQTTP